MKLSRILVADDHHHVRYAIVEALSEKFQVVGSVSDGNELVESAKRLLPDVIVSDIFMAQMDGFKARNELIAHQLVIPFVFVSSLGKEVVEFVQNDSVAFVYKLELLPHVIHAVEAVLAGRRYLSPFYGG